jgi:dTDP-4-amino-4,6-dideoxygalactose transaminase
VNTLSKFIVFNQPDIGEEEMSAVMDVLRSGWIGTGKVSQKFEEEFSDFYGGGYAVAVSSCTMGLQLALRVLNLPYKSRVLTSPLTFAATVNAILANGGQPVFKDVNEKGCIDYEGDYLTFVPVHYSGTMCDIKVPHGTRVVEDCAHAFGSPLKREGDFQVFSFYANKNITAGEGGMILTKDKKLADEIRILSAQGLSRGAWNRYGAEMPRHYSVESVGMKGNLPDILAAIGLVQLRRWPEMKSKRDLIFKIYEKAFGEMPLGHSTHFYPLRTENRDHLRNKLHERGIGAGIHYKPLHLEPAYQFLGYQRGDFPEAEKWGDQELSLPVSSKMSEEDALKVVEIIKETKGEI